MSKRKAQITITASADELAAAIVRSAGGVTQADIRRAAKKLGEVVEERGLTGDSPARDLVAATVEAHKRFEKL